MTESARVDHCYSVSIYSDSIKGPHELLTQKDDRVRGGEAPVPSQNILRNLLFQVQNLNQYNVFKVLFLR